MNQVNPMNRIVIMALDEVGVIADISKTLGDEGINVESINVEVVGAEVTVILTTDRYDHAWYVLNQAGFKAVSDDAVVVRLKDEPGALAALADRLRQAGVNIQNLHILVRQEGYALVALTTSDRAATSAAIANEEVI